MIKPTVGRVVLFWPSAVDEGEDTKQPYAATVAYVHSDRMVNLSVADHCGRQYGLASVPLLQEGDERPSGMYCEWMPYQKGQAPASDQVTTRLSELEGRVSVVEGCAAALASQKANAAEAGWKVQDPRPTISDVEALIGKHGNDNVRLEPNGDVMVREAPGA